MVYVFHEYNVLRATQSSPRYKKIPALSGSLPPSPRSLPLAPQVDLWLQRARVGSCRRLSRSKTRSPEPRAQVGACRGRCRKGSCLLVAKHRSGCRPVPSWRQKQRLFLCAEEQEGSSAVQEVLASFRKKQPVLFPRRFFLRACSPMLSSSKFFLACPLSFLSMVFRRSPCAGREQGGCGAARNAGQV